MDNVKEWKYEEPKPKPCNYFKSSSFFGCCPICGLWSDSDKECEYKEKD